MSGQHQHILENLRQVSPNTIWGLAIREKVKGDVSEEELRELMGQLKSQANDNPAMMQRIVGAHVFEVLSGSA
jgi:hypothetical protein